MIAKEITQHLEQVQRNTAGGKKAIEDISQTELDQIRGAGGTEGFLKFTKSF